MLILITYDVNVTSDGGQRRLNRIAKVCLDFGVRVQNSVFECEVTPSEYISLKDLLLKECHLEKDSLRFYLLGKKGRDKITHIGAKVVQNPAHDTLIL